MQIKASLLLRILTYNLDLSRSLGLVKCRIKQLCGLMVQFIDEKLIHEERLLESACGKKLMRGKVSVELVRGNQGAEWHEEIDK